MKAEQMFEEIRYKRNEKNGEINYFQRFGSGYFRITFDLSKEEIAIDTNMENVIESDLLQAIVQQVKELGWLGSEQSQETNYEHYKDEIIEDCIDNIAIIEGKPHGCMKVPCNDCQFYTGENFNCHGKTVEWLKSPYKKPKYKLTKFEHDLLNAYKDCGMLKPVSHYSAMHELHEKGYFKDIDTSIPIYEILSSCEVVKDENS